MCPSFHGKPPINSAGSGKHFGVYKANKYEETNNFPCGEIIAHDKR